MAIDGFFGIRILHSGSKPPDKGDAKNHVSCRILSFLGGAKPSYSFGLWEHQPLNIPHLIDRLDR